MNKPYEPTEFRLPSDMLVGHHNCQMHCVASATSADTVLGHRVMRDDTASQCVFIPLL